MIDENPHVVIVVGFFSDTHESLAREIENRPIDRDYGCQPSNCGDDSRGPLMIDSSAMKLYFKYMF